MTYSNVSVGYERFGGLVFSIFRVKKTSIWIFTTVKASYLVTLQCSWWWVETLDDVTIATSRQWMIVCGSGGRPVSAGRRRQSGAYLWLSGVISVFYSCYVRAGRWGKLYRKNVVKNCCKWYKDTTRAYSQYVSSCLESHIFASWYSNSNWPWGRTLFYHFEMNRFDTSSVEIPLLTSWCREFFEKLIVSQVVNTFPLLSWKSMVCYRCHKIPPLVPESYGFSPHFHAVIFWRRPSKLVVHHYHSIIKLLLNHS
jgi:hypothetical protein